jgi:hypothetical protein
VGTRDAKGEGRKDHLPGIWSLGLQLPVPPLLFQTLSSANQVQDGISGYALIRVYQWLPRCSPNVLIRLRQDQ